VLLSFLLIVLLVGMTTNNSFGQQVFGNIFGTVTDPTGAAIPNAKVIVTDQNKGTKFDVTTNESGNYVKNQLIPGTYQVEVENPGFRKSISKDIVVNVDQGSRVDLILQVGDVTQEVEVTAAAPLLQTDRADVATTYNTQQLENLPNFTRNFQSFELLTPGAQRLEWNHAASENPQGSVQIQVNGQAFSATGYELDGTSNQDPILGIIVINPNLDGVTETRISGQNYDAEFWYTGAGIINASTKSGTNEIHGSAFEFLQNISPGFQDGARNPFNSAENNQLPAVKQNQFGGSIGGAIIKNKLFYFGDAQLTRNRQGSTVKTSVPTAAARMGDLSGYLNGGTNQIYDPLTGDPATGVGRTPFQNNMIPMDRLSQQALNILALIPLPNAPGDAGAAYRNNYVAAGARKFDVNNFDTRMDYFINEKSSLFGRYSYQPYQLAAPGAFGLEAGGPALDNINFAGNSDVLNQSLAIGYNYTFSPTLITEVRFGYERYRVQVTPNGLGTSPAMAAGIPGLNTDKFYTSGLPYFEIHGDNDNNLGPGGMDFGYSLGANQCNCPLNEREQQYQFVNNTTKIYKNHSFKFGTDLRYAENLRVPSDSHRAGELIFQRGYTGSVDQNGATTGGYGLATFLLGEATTFQRYVSSSTDAQERQRRFFFYGQDTWRITPKLTVNYGLRWELIFPETVNKAGNGANLSLNDGLLHVFGIGQTSDHGIQNMNYGNFAPRLGIAYQLNPKTVIRTGYGWAYSLGTFGTSFGHNVTQNLPVLANQQLNRANNFSGVFSLTSGPPAPPSFSVDPTTGTLPCPVGIDCKVRPADMRLPRTEAYNITVERQITNNIAVSAGYVGNTTRHGFTLPSGQLINANQPDFVPGVSNTNLLRPYFAKFGWTQNIDFYCDCANSHYDSLQIQTTIRNMQGLTVQFNYTYQNEVGDTGDDNYTFLYNRALGRGLADNFSHHLLTAAENYEVPFGRGKKYGSSISKGMDYLLGGWVINGVTTFVSGRAFTPNIGTFPAGLIRPNVGPGGRPDIGSGDPYSVGGSTGDRNHFFGGIYTIPGDPTSGLSGAYAFPGDNTFGNFGINTLSGPIFVTQDLSLAKRFNIYKEGRARLELRAEAFNAFNHTNLGDPNTDITSPSVGQITGLPGAFGSMRRLQFAARVDF